MSKFLMILCCVISFQAFSQAPDKAKVMVDSNLAVGLNDLPRDTTINGFRFLNYSKDHIYYQVIINNTIPLSTPTENLFRITLAGIRDGMTNRPEFKTFSFIDVDTLIGGVPGKFIHFYSQSKDAKIKEMFYFLTIQNHHSYSVVAAIDKPVDEIIWKEIERFFNRTTFKGSPYDGFRLPELNPYSARKPFVPIDYEYPAEILSSPKTFVYKNLSTSALLYKNISRKDTANSVIIRWKEYDSSSLAELSTEINDKSVGHYLVINGKYFLSILNADSTYQNGSRLGEKVQSESFKINVSTVLTSSIRSQFVKDTLINWEGKSLPTIVIKSEAKLVYQDLTGGSQERQSFSETLHYFAKGIGLIEYSTKDENGLSTWFLTEIRQKN